MSLGRRSVTRDGRGATYKTDQYDYEMLCTDLSQKKFFPIVATIKAHTGEVAEQGQFPESGMNDAESLLVAGEIAAPAGVNEKPRAKGAGLAGVIARFDGDGVRRAVVEFSDGDTFADFSAGRVGVLQ